MRACVRACACACVCGCVAVAVAVAVWLTTVLLRTAETPSSTTGRPAVVHQSLYDLPLRQVSARHQVGLVIEPSKHGVPFALAVDLHYDSDSRESGQLSPDDGQLAAPASRDSALFSLQYVLEGDAQASIVAQEVFKERNPVVATAHGGLHMKHVTDVALPVLRLIHA